MCPRAFAESKHVWHESKWRLRRRLARFVTVWPSTDIERAAHKPLLWQAGQKVSAVSSSTSVRPTKSTTDQSGTLATDIRCLPFTEAKAAAAPRRSSSSVEGARRLAPGGSRAGRVGEGNVRLRADVGENQRYQLVIGAEGDAPPVRTVEGYPAGEIGTHAPATLPIGNSESA